MIWLAHIPDLLAAFAIGAAATALSWLFVRRFAPQDVGGGRRSHQGRTPRAGGLGVAMMLSTLLYWLYPDLEALWLIPAMAMLGLLDDFFPQPALLRLVLQLALALLAVIDMGDLTLQSGASLVRIALALVLVGFVNLANFFDGRNGLLTGCFIVVMLISPWLGVQHKLAWVVAGLWLGFLPFNFPRAKLFMGDVGSYCIGATLGLICLQMTYVSSDGALAFLLACFGILLDPVLTLLKRGFAGKAVWQAHREHLYQFFARTGANETKLLAGYALYTLMSAALAVWALHGPANAIWVAFLVWGLTSAVLWFCLRRAVLAYARRARSRSLTN
jgi:UDP-N-acetylmuramyl pentapeptide phosphotransferase/UDP-N-acetylglucosamine-1-phosphate transferase